MLKIGDIVKVNTISRGEITIFQAEDGIPSRMIVHGSTRVRVDEYERNYAEIVNIYEKYYLVKIPTEMREVDYVILGFKENQLTLVSSKTTSKKMKLSEYKKIAKIRDRITVMVDQKPISGLCGCKNGKLDNDYFYFWQNELDGNHNTDPKGEYRYSYPFMWNDNNEVEVEGSGKLQTKKRKAYIEITRETGEIFISLKIPSEIEEFFKTTSNGDVQQSEAWFQKDKGVMFYKQPAELEKKLLEIDDYVFSSYGFGLMKNGKINVAILRSVGVSKGIKIHSKGFESFSNADLQDYVRKLGLYIKILWESNVSTTRIKSVITFEI
jgi:hypothetical protein